MLCGIHSGQRHGLVVDQPFAAIISMRVDAAHLGIGFGAYDKKGAKLMQLVEAFKIQVGTVHHVDGTGFQGHCIKNVDIVKFGFGDFNECGYVALQIQQSMNFDAGFGGTKPCPGK